jgi:hypothetical protein
MSTTQSFKVVSYDRPSMYMKYLTVDKLSANTLTVNGEMYATDRIYISPTVNTSGTNILYNTNGYLVFKGRDGTVNVLASP